MSDFLVFEDISKSFGSLIAVDHVSFSIKKGIIFSLLGPSGCGKTTLLRIVAGFETPDTGRIILDGRDITDLPPHERKVNTIFQSYALFPHLSVWENIAFGLRIAKQPRKVIEAEVERMLALIQMEDHAYKKPHQISGGQKQRVAIARALINKPEVLLLDEPLAALDLKLRQRMLMELDLIHEEVGVTFLYVTHDQGEAMSLSDSLAVMNKGHIEQMGTPAEVYEAPKSSFVAAFIGDTNIFDGTVAEVVEGEYSRLIIEGFGNLLCFNDKHIDPGDPVHLSIRPEKFKITHQEPVPKPRVNAIRGRVQDIVYLGSHTKYWVQAGEYRVAVLQQHTHFLLDEEQIRWGDEVWLMWHADNGFMLEKYQASDESLLYVPPEGLGDSNGAAANAAATGGQDKK